MDINGEALKAIRIRSGFTLTALAREAGIKHPHLSNIEAGRRRASPPVGVAIAKALGVPLIAILSRPEEKVA